MLAQLLMVAAAGLGAGADAREAEKVFRRMEVAVMKATTIDVAFDVTLEGVFQGTLKGNLVFKTKNKTRLEFNGDFAVGGADKKPFKMLMISDGAKMLMTTLGPNPEPQISETMKELGEMQKVMMVRSGIACPIFMLAENIQPGQKPREFNADEQLKVVAFKFDKDEKVGERAARVLQYNLVNRNFTDPLGVSLWLDAQTNLPLKRVVTVMQSGQAMTLREIYSKITLNGKVDEKGFALPK